MDEKVHSLTDEVRTHRKANYRPWIPGFGSRTLAAAHPVRITLSASSRAGRLGSGCDCRPHLLLRSDSNPSTLLCLQPDSISSADMPNAAPG
jgi:hypothetical protein